VNELIFMANMNNQLQEKDYEPKLLLPNLQGGHFEEYIPHDFSSKSQKLRDHYVA